MASGRLVFSGRMPAIDPDGVPYPDARMFFYVNRTTTLATVYADEALTAPLQNPVPADSSGNFVPIWADQTLLFSASLDSITLGKIDTIDDLAPSNSVGGAANKLDKDGGNREPDILTNLPYLAPADDAAPRAVSDKLAETLSVQDFSDAVPGNAFQFARDAAGGPKKRAVNVAAGDYDLNYAVPGGQTYVFDGLTNLNPAAGFTPTPPPAPQDYRMTGSSLSGQPTLAASKFIAFSGMNRETLNGGGDVIAETFPFDTMYVGQALVDGEPPFERVFRELGAADVEDTTGRRSVSLGTLSVVASSGNAAVFGGSRSSDNNSGGDGGTMGGFFSAMNDGGNTAAGAWGVYVDAVQKNGSGTIFGMEVDTTSYYPVGSLTPINPFNMFAGGQPIGAIAWLANGGFQPHASDLTCGIGLLANFNCIRVGGTCTVSTPPKVDKGIVVHSDFLKDQGGGYGELMAIPKSYIAQYIDAGVGGQIVGGLYFGVNNYLAGSRVIIDDAGFSVINVADGVNKMNVNSTGYTFGPAGAPWFTGDVGGMTIVGGLAVGGGPGNDDFRVIPVAGVNRVEVLGALTGASPIVQAGGSDARIPLLVAGKNAGIQLSNNYIFATGDADAATKGVLLFETYINTSNLNALTPRVS